MSACSKSVLDYSFGISEVGFVFPQVSNIRRPGAPDVGWFPTFATDHPSDEDLSPGTPVSREDGARKFSRWLAGPCCDNSPHSLELTESP